MLSASKGLFKKDRELKDDLHTALEEFVAGFKNHNNVSCTVYVFQ